MDPTASVLLLNHYERLSPRVALEAATLRQAGYRIWTLYWDRSATPQPPAKRGCSSFEIRIPYPASRGTLRLLPRLPLFYLRAIRRLQAERARFDIVHCTHLMLLPLAVYLKARWKSKIIYDVYEFHLHETSERLPGGLRWLVPLLRRLEDVLVRRVDGVLTVDSVGGELEHRYRALNPNTLALYNVPEAQPEFDPGKLEELERHYANRDLVIYVGGLSEAKGALILPEVIHHVAGKCPRVLFIIIGTFHKDSTRRRFWAMIEELGVKGFLEFLPWLPYREMLYYVALSKVGLALYQPIPRYLRSSRGNGRKFFTYMQVGIPIVGPRFGEIGRVVQEENCGLLVDTADPEAVAQAVLFLLENPKEAREMGKRGQVAVRERYNWDIERRKLLRVYAKALEDAS